MLISVISDSMFKPCFYFLHFMGLVMLKTIDFRSCRNINKRTTIRLSQYFPDELQFAHFAYMYRWFSVVMSRRLVYAGVHRPSSYLLVRLLKHKEINIIDKEIDTT